VADELLFFIPSPKINIDIQENIRYNVTYQENILVSVKSSVPERNRNVKPKQENFLIGGDAHGFCALYEG
jgi:hypothetical protein